MRIMKTFKEYFSVMGMLIITLLAVLLIFGCRDLLLSKEQRQVNDAIRQAIKNNPSLLNAPYQDGEPPLHLALSNRLPGLFYWLLSRGADPNARDQRGQTALHDAVYYDFKEQTMMRVLIEHGAKVNAKSDNGSTPLHLAAFALRAPAAEALLAARADPNARDQLGETPLHRASIPQPFASPEEVARTIHLLVAGGADAGAHSANGNTPLHQAALIGSVSATRALITEGAQVDMPGLGGGTALHVAATFGKSKVAEVLLQAGADPDRRDDNGLTPLERAEKYPAFTSKGKGAGPVDTREVVALLRKFGATDQDAPPHLSDKTSQPGAFSLRRNPKTGFAVLQVNESLLRKPTDFLLRGVCRFDPDTGHWQQVPWSLIGTPTRLTPSGANLTRVLVQLPREVALFCVYWTETEAGKAESTRPAEVWREALAASGPVLCNDIDLGPPPAGAVAACVPFPDRAQARFVPAPAEECGVILPLELSRTYDELVAAFQSGKQGEIEKSCLPGKIKFTAKPRPDDRREYGQDINLPFLKDGFSKEVLNFSKNADGEYLIRTGTTALWFEKTKDGKWKLSKYLDKPIE